MKPEKHVEEVISSLNHILTLLNPSKISIIYIIDINRTQRQSQICSGAPERNVWGAIRPFIQLRR